MVLSISEPEQGADTCFKKKTCMLSRLCQFERSLSQCAPSKNAMVKSKFLVNAMFESMFLEIVLMESMVLVVAMLKSMLLVNAMMESILLVSTIR